jgi:chromosome segregation ATPase
LFVRCGVELEKGAAVYCTACLASIQHEFEQKAKKREKAASAVYTRLQVTESQKAELEELLRHKEQVVAELELKVSNLSQDLDKAHQFQAALGSLQPTLDGIDERLKALERAQNKINERMLQLAERVHEMYDNTGFLAVIKRSLGQYRRQGT